MKKYLNFILLFLICFAFFSFNNVKASSNLTMDSTLAQKFLDYYSIADNLQFGSSTLEVRENCSNIIKNIDVNNFITFWNNTVVPALNSSAFSNLDIDFSNLTCYAQLSDSDIIYFYIGIFNNTDIIDNNLKFSKLTFGNTNLTVSGQGSSGTSGRIYFVYGSSFGFDLGNINSNNISFFHNNVLPTINGNEITLNGVFPFSDNQKIYYNESQYNFPNYFSNNDSPNIPDSGDTTYFNYDYNEYFIRPYIRIENVNGLAQYSSDSANIPFNIFSQSGDEYYPFESLKMDLRVIKVTQSESGESIFGSVVDSFKKYSGDFADTTGFSSVSTNGEIIKHTYDLKSKFDSNFINQYLNDFDGEDYAFQLVLYNVWGDVISLSKIFYFYDTNSLNSFPITNDYYNNILDNSGYSSSNFDIDYSNNDFSSLVNTFTSFMSTIMSFWAFLPPWLIALLTLGVTAAITLRVLGR